MRGGEGTATDAGPDLAQYHEPIRYRRNGDRTPYELTPEQIQRYERDGYLAGIPVLNDEELEGIRAEIDRLADPDHDGREHWYEYNDLSGNVFQGGFLHGSGAWRVSPALHDLLWNPAITVPLSQLVRGRVRLLHDQLLSKPPRHGGTAAWHQDYAYWTYTQPMAHATCWIALDDSTIENGCVHYVPGSHRWGVLLPRANGPGNEALFEHLDDERKAAFNPVPAEVPAGSAILHHPLMIHGSHANQSDLPRRATTLHVMRDGTRAAEELPDIDGIPAWLLGGAGGEYELTDEPAGPVLGGRYFPLLI